MVFANFSLLIIAASGKLEWATGLPRTRYLVLILVPLAFVCVWAIGWVMDTVVKAPELQGTISASRSLETNEILSILRRLDMNYKPYPTVKTNPNRKQRKGLRSKVFQDNKKAAEDRRKGR